MIFTCEYKVQFNYGIQQYTDVIVNKHGLTKQRENYILPLRITSYMEC